jgi:hypothetical protein
LPETDKEQIPRRAAPTTFHEKIPAALVMTTFHGQQSFTAAHVSGARIAARLIPEAGSCQNKITVVGCRERTLGCHFKNYSG